MHNRRAEFEGKLIWQAAPLFDLPKLLVVWISLSVLLCGYEAMNPSRDQSNEENPVAATFIGP
jgi:hypothetical protein